MTSLFKLLGNLSVFLGLLLFFPFGLFIWLLAEFLPELFEPSRRPEDEV